MDTLLIRNGTVVNAEDGTMVQADILAEGSGIRKAEPGICDRAVSEIDATGCYVTGGPPYPYLSHGVHRDLWRGRLLWFWSHNGCGCREHGLRDL